MNPLPAQVEMVADLYEIDAINEVTADALVAATGLDEADAAVLLIDRWDARHDGSAP